MLKIKNIDSVLHTWAGQEIEAGAVYEEKKKAVRFLRTLMIGCAIGAAIWALLLFLY